MQVTCEYCDSYLDTEGLTCCPNCGAPLGDAIKVVEEQIAAKEEAAAAQQAEQEAQEREDAKQEQLFDTIKSIAMGLTGAAAGTAVSRSISGNSSRSAGYNNNMGYGNPPQGPGGMGNRQEGPGGFGNRQDGGRPPMPDQNGRGGRDGFRQEQRPGNNNTDNRSGNLAGLFGGNNNNAGVNRASNGNQRDFRQNGTPNRNSNAGVSRTSNGVNRSPANQSGNLNNLFNNNSASVRSNNQGSRAAANGVKKTLSKNDHKGGK